MILRNIGKIVSLTTAAVAVSFGTVAGASGATTPNTAPDVTYTASGTFSNPASSGADTLKLAGEPFTISIVANSASVPKQHGPNWAVMNPFKMTGSVHSGLLGPTPINIASGSASILQLVGPSYDIFTCAFPVTVVGISLTIQATVYLPPGTITTPLIHPFPTISLNPSPAPAIGSATVIYSNGTDTTTLTVATGGTLSATIPGGNGTQASVASPAVPAQGEVAAEPAVLVAFNKQTVLKLVRLS
jgi:hypothetical protein